MSTEQIWDAWMRWMDTLAVISSRTSSVVNTDKISDRKKILTVPNDATVIADALIELGVEETTTILKALSKLDIRTDHFPAYLALKRHWDDYLARLNTHAKRPVFDREDAMRPGSSTRYIEQITLDDADSDPLWLKYVGSPCTFFAEIATKIKQSRSKMRRETVPKEPIPSAYTESDCTRWIEQMKTWWQTHLNIEIGNKRLSDQRRVARELVTPSIQQCLEVLTRVSGAFQHDPVHVLGLDDATTRCLQSIPDQFQKIVSELEQFDASADLEVMKYLHKLHDDTQRFITKQKPPESMWLRHEIATKEYFRIRFVREWAQQVTEMYRDLQRQLTTVQQDLGPYTLTSGPQRAIEIIQRILQEIQSDLADEDAQLTTDELERKTVYDKSSEQVHKHASRSDIYEYLHHVSKVLVEITGSGARDQALKLLRGMMTRFESARSKCVFHASQKLKELETKTLRAVSDEFTGDQRVGIQEICGQYIKMLNQLLDQIQQWDLTLSPVHEWPVLYWNVHTDRSVPTHDLSTVLGPFMDTSVLSHFETPTRRLALTTWLDLVRSEPTHTTLFQCLWDLIYVRLTIGSVEKNSDPQISTPDQESKYNHDDRAAAAEKQEEAAVTTLDQTKRPKRKHSVAISRTETVPSRVRQRV